MKKIVMLITLITSVIFGGDKFSNNWDTFSIGVRSNNFQTATFSNKNLVYGLDFLHIGFSLETTEYNYWDGEYDSNSFDLSINVFMPRIGYRKKIGIFDRINTYAQIESFLVIPFASISGEGSSASENDLEDLFDSIGFRGCYIIEYMFNDQLSLSADVGLNWVFNSFELPGGEFEEYNDEISTNIATSFTKLSLNFKL